MRGCTTPPRVMVWSYLNCHVACAEGRTTKDCDVLRVVFCGRCVFRGLCVESNWVGEPRAGEGRAFELVTSPPRCSPAPICFPPQPWWLAHIKPTHIQSQPDQNAYAQHTQPARAHAQPTKHPPQHIAVCCCAHPHCYPRLKALPTPQHITVFCCPPLSHGRCGSSGKIAQSRAAAEMHALEMHPLILM